MDKKQQKLAALRKYIKGLGSAAIAFSGGADSAFLLNAAYEALGQNVIALTAKSCFAPAADIEYAISFCRKYGIRHEIMEVDPLSWHGIAKNTPERCYLCKKRLFSLFSDYAGKHGIRSVCDGSNAGDTADFRPGMQALRELGIKSPLLHCGINKEEIRFFLHEKGLSVWNRPSSACLASRIPYGEKITAEKLAMAEQSEQFLHSLGMTQLRVRIHGGNMARIEAISSEMPLVMQKKAEIFMKFKEIGFSYTALDLQGYRTGSLNEVLPRKTNASNEQFSNEK